MLVLLPNIDMPILNYTTRVAVDSSVAEIMRMLTKAGASAIMVENDDTGTITGMRFKILMNGKPIAFKLPVQWREILQIIMQDKRVPGSKKNDEHAKCVAWRIMKDWIEVQLALIDVRMVTLDQVFLPYAVGRDGRTFYEIAKTGNLLSSPSEN